MATSPNPSTTTTTAAATRPFTKTPPRPQNPHHSPFPIPHHHQPHLFTSQNLPIRPQIQPPNPNSSVPLPYPVASSGRGYIPRPVRHHDQTVTVANPNPTSVGYHPRAVGVGHRHTVGSGSPRSHPYSDGGLVQRSYSAHAIRQHPTQMQHQQQHCVGVPAGVSAASPQIKGIPVTGQFKVAPSPVADSNGYRDMRDRSGYDTLVTVRDRKVRIADGSSLYALCQSWLRNGYPVESQPLYGDVARSLPRPLPLPVVDDHSPRKEGEEAVEEDEEDEESIDHLSTQDLLNRHIKRAKKVRSRLREERLKRIARYKTRLALLLPPQVEQFRNDTAAGN